MKQSFIKKRFNKAATALIGHMQGVLTNYARQGYDLSLRQLYYQLVSKNVVPNTEQSYKRVGACLSEARLAGLIDWNMIIDRGRYTSANSHWDSPASIINTCVRSFAYEKWLTQPWHVEVMVEKQALEGVLQPVCGELDIPFTSNKGYSSSSAMYRAGKRIKGRLDAGKDICILYLGDHDPSGLDMSRDVEDRLKLFSGYGYYNSGDECVYDSGDYDNTFDVRRVALNMDQIKQYNPPPNPTKMTDSRAGGYCDKYGMESWELDALEPSVLAALVRDAVLGIRDEELWDAAIEREGAAKGELKTLSDISVKRAARAANRPVVR